MTKTRAQLVAARLALCALLAAGGSPARAGAQHAQQQVLPTPANVLKSIQAQGIVVPKSPILIAGLDHQFRGRARDERNSTSAAPAKGLLAAVANLADPRRPSRRQQQQQQQQPQAPPGGLYLDRRQQEILAANPQLAAGGPAALAVRSDAAPAPEPAGNPSAAGQQPAPLSQSQPLAPLSSGNLTNDAKQQPAGDAWPGQQLYRGYSLIELEVRSEADRRFVQQLYANLSAALNEQAKRAHASSVSPYVDIDFWSFKCALNDQIDIMVSPKSRAFVLNQLNRNRIKSRVKIDDIQARLDAQAAPAGSQNMELSGRQSSAPTSERQPGGLAGRQQQQQQQPQAAGAGGHLAASRPESPVDGRNSLAMNDTLFFDNYQRLADINEYLESLVARARDVARVQVIGRSSQGRYLRVLRLGYEQRDVDGSTDEPGAEPELQADERGPGQQAGQPPATNATRIVEHFLRQQRRVRKLGAIWLDGGTHAREWISPATVLYMAFRLADNHARCARFFGQLQTLASQASASAAAAAAAASARSLVAPPPRAANLNAELLEGINEINSSLLGGPAGRPRPRTEFEQTLERLARRPHEVAGEHQCDLEQEQLLRRYTFLIQPVLNPDGYEYSHTHNRLWRKTRSTSNHPIYRHFCLGADPNRNYDARHGATGSSGHPCSQTYGGATPFTEPETRHQSNFVYANRNQLKMFISFHSYSQMILLPYSHSKQLAPDHKDLESVGQAAVRAIERTHGTQYRVGASASILYTASGTASDWAYEKAGVKYSYTIELRDTGAYGFLLPRQQIVPTGEETFNGLLAMIGQMEKNDNLLMSKSSASLGAEGGAAGGLANATLAPAAELIHAPDLDQLRPFGRFRPRPAQLENAIDGSDTWASGQPAALGVRDRRPPVADDAGGAQSGRLDAALAAAAAAGHRIEDEPLAGPVEEPDAGYVFEGEGELMEPTDALAAAAAVAMSGRRQDEAQAGGAGRDLLKRRRAELAQLYGDIHAAGETSSDDDKDDDDDGRHSGDQAGGAAGLPARRQAQQKLPAAMVLSANGRNLINSPPLPSRTTPSSARRELAANQRFGGA